MLLSGADHVRIVSVRKQCLTMVTTHKMHHENLRQTCRQEAVQWALELHSYRSHVSALSAAHVRGHEALTGAALVVFTPQAFPYNANQPPAFLNMSRNLSSSRNGADTEAIALLLIQLLHGHHNVLSCCTLLDQQSIPHSHPGISMPSWGKLWEVSAYHCTPPKDHITMCCFNVFIASRHS